MRIWLRAHKENMRHLEMEHYNTFPLHPDALYSVSVNKSVLETLSGCVDDGD